MTEIATRQDAALALTPTPSEAITAAIEQWVGGMAAAVRGAEMIVDTPLCPDSFWPVPTGVKAWQMPDKNPKVQHPNESRESYLARRQVAAYTLGGVVRYGLGLGLAPEVSLTGIFMIGGRPSMYADQMVALIKSHGHKHRIVERTAEKCTVEVHRIGDAEPQSLTYTFEDAVRNGYVPGQGPNKGKDRGGNEKYLTHPANMLEARCNTELLTSVFPDVLRGMTSREAMDDERAAVTVTVEETAPAPRASAAAILARAATPAPEPETVAAQVRTSEPAPVPEPEVHRYAMPVSKQKLDLIKAAFERHSLGATRGQAGAEQREKRMAVLSSLLDRPITDPRDLTADEGQMVIDNLGTDDGARVIAEILNPELQAQRYAASDAEAEQVARAAAGLDEDDYAAAVQQQEDEAARAEAAAQA